MIAGDLFREHVTTILGRFFRQNDRVAPTAGEFAAVASSLLALVEERGLPRPLAKSESGEPGEMPDAEITPLLDRVLQGVAKESREALAAPVRQLVKACLYPEFKKCRDSFREVAPDGTCRRQELARTRGRISGAHCVDCPHWVALSPAQHWKYLSREWQPARKDELDAGREVFLPEDFRSLRIFLHQQARLGV
ncbi:MAG: hypothetical protein JWM32_1227 [Verrucomicrobia bacterium]|nr:hypothetical protein [Verrucomicrobiota bacterium]